MNAKHAPVLILAAAGASWLVAAACATPRKETKVSVPENPVTEKPGPAAEPAPGQPAAQNPLAARWSGPHGGVPAFDRVKVEHLEPAIDAAIAEYRRAVRAIATSKEPPTFGNTLAALEAAERPLAEVLAVYGVWSTALSTPEFQTVERAIEPRLAALSDEVYQDAELFARIEALQTAPERASWKPEQARLAWWIHKNFVRAGARLDPAAKKRMAEINSRLATLFTTFNQTILAAEEKSPIVLPAEADLAGLPPELRAAAAAAAEAQGHKGKWVIQNTRSAVEPFLTYSSRRDLRERVWRNFVSRGEGGAHDTRALIVEILKLRAERAALLGYPTHAHWRVEDSMAKTPERALELLTAVWPAAVARVRAEVADMQAIANREGAKVKIAPWDYRHYAEKVRKARYDLDENEVKPYLDLEKLREGAFWVAGELFGLAFTPVADVPVYHPDVRVWEVTERATGRRVGLYYFDPFARPGKRSGAWMDSYRPQHRLGGVEVTAIVSNNLNFLRGAPGAPVLVSWDDATTLFHEFGHALHGLSSNVTYPTLSGTAVVRDFVEFPSQLLEHWLPTPELLDRFARHHETGAPIPAALVEKLRRAETFNQGFKTLEYLSSALVDLKLHLAGGAEIDPAAFERDTLKALGMPSELVMRHRTPHFSHIFSSDGYSAGYYSYLWADTLTADAFEAFTAASGPYDRDVAGRLARTVLSVGNTADPAESYRAFRGRDAGIEALMRDRGFPVPKAKGRAPAGKAR